MSRASVSDAISAHARNSLRVIELLMAVWAIAFIYLFATNVATTAPFLPLSLGATGIWAVSYTTRTKVA